MKYIIFFLFLFFTPVSQAKLHFEPYGNIGASYSSSLSDSHLFFMTYAVGTRLGYNISFLHMGIDLFWTYHDIGNSSRFHNLEIYHQPDPVIGFSQAQKSVSLHYSEIKDPFSPLSIGVFAAAELPFLVNVYGTLFYTLGEESEIKHQGYGIKGGASYLTTFHIQLNLELQWAHYICGEAVKCSNNFSILSAMLSLSVPFSFDVFDRPSINPAIDNLVDESSTYDNLETEE